jgi:predicted ABC-type ATPase
MNIYIIAGPPGIGKSTSASRYIPRKVSVIDQDLAANQYKKEGFADYKELGIMSGQQQIRSCLFSKEDFALELNLGFQSHYDYLKNLAYFNTENKVHLILFYTDTVDLCLFRANSRHIKGGHLVKPEIVTEMYNNTIPLFKENTRIFKSMSFINITNTTIKKVTPDNPPHWVKDNDLEKYL